MNPTAELKAWKRRAIYFERALKDEASGWCCGTPGCGADTPSCDVGRAKAALKYAPPKPKKTKESQ